MIHPPEITLWHTLRELDPAVIGGLVVEYGERERATTNRWDEDGMSGVEHWLGGQLARLVVIADGGTPRTLQRLPQGQLRFLERRLFEITWQWRHVGPRPLLATPDHPAGWLQPGTLVDRINGLTGPPQDADLVAAILRLGADGRDEALAALAATGEVAHAVRYALGGDAVPRKQIVTVPLWVAAGRVRSSDQPDPLLLSAKLGRPGQGVPARPVPTPTVTVDRVHDHYYQKWVTIKNVDFIVACPGAKEWHDPDGLQPTAEVWGRSRTSAPGGAWSGGAWLRWAALTYPVDADHFLVLGLPQLVRSASAGTISASYDDAHVLDALAAHPGALGRLAATAIAVGLSVHRIEDGSAPSTSLSTAPQDVSRHPGSVTGWRTRRGSGPRAGSPRLCGTCPQVERQPPSSTS